MGSDKGMAFLATGISVFAEKVFSFKNRKKKTRLATTFKDYNLQYIALLFLGIV